MINRQKKVNEKIQEARSRIHRDGVPFTREHYEAFQRPYSDDWTRMSDRWNVKAAFDAIVASLAKTEDELRYRRILHEIHIGLQEIAATIGVSPECLAEICGFEPSVAMLDDNGKKRPVNVYWHLPPEKQDPLTQFYLRHKEQENVESPGSGAVSGEA